MINCLINSIFKKLFFKNHFKFESSKNKQPKIKQKFEISKIKKSLCPKKYFLKNSKFPKKSNPKFPYQNC